MSTITTTAPKPDPDVDGRSDAVVLLRPGALSGSARGDLLDAHKGLRRIDPSHATRIVRRPLTPASGSFSSMTLTDARRLEMAVRLIDRRLLWEEWRSAAGDVWEAWDGLLEDDCEERHERYLDALDGEELAAGRLATALAP